MFELVNSRLEYMYQIFKSYTGFFIMPFEIAKFNVKYRNENFIQMVYVCENGPKILDHDE